MFCRLVPAGQVADVGEVAVELALTGVQVLAKTLHHVGGIAQKRAQAGPCLCDFIESGDGRRLGRQLVAEQQDGGGLHGDVLIRPVDHAVNHLQLRYYIYKSSGPGLLIDGLLGPGEPYLGTLRGTTRRG